MITRLCSPTRLYRAFSVFQLIVFVQCSHNIVHGHNCFEQTSSDKPAQHQTADRDSLSGAFRLKTASCFPQELVETKNSAKRE